MAIVLEGFTFEGPLAAVGEVKAEGGVCVVLGKDEEKECMVVDVVNSRNLKMELSDRRRRDCWERSGFTTLLYAPRYIPDELDEEKEEVEKTLRLRYVPPCGKEGS